MRNRIVAAALALVALPALGAIQYEFVQKNTTDDRISPTSELTGRATVDGLLSRIDVIGGTLYPPGTYVISTDGSGRLYFVDPSKKWYTEYTAAGIDTALGAANIKITNIKSSFDVQADRPVILGAETDHSRMKISYDITLVRKGIPLKGHVETEIESWMTLKYGNVHASSVTSIASTGDPDIDRLITGDSAKLRGFPMRQSVTTRTTFNLTGKSKLDVSPSRTIIRETWVTSIRETPPNAAMFNVPASYRRADTPEVPAATTQVLTFDPPAK